MKTIDANNYHFKKKGFHQVKGSDRKDNSMK